MNNKKIKFGVVGVGYLGKHHVKHLSQFDFVDLIGIYDVNQKLMAELLNFYQSKPNLKFLTKAADALEQGGLIIYPTDTVYALGCLSDNLQGLQRLANIKEVRLDKAPFSFFMRDFSDLSNYVKPLDNSTFKLLKRCLPGPYTFILPCLKLHKPFEKRKSIGIRMAKHPILEAFTELLKVPLITTSLHDQDEILDYTTDPDMIYER